jgi:hypothetical protein
MSDSKNRAQCLLPRRIGQRVRRMTAQNDKTQGPVTLSGELPPAAASSHGIFVSYASGDAAVADALVTMLEDQGFRCWIAPRDVAPGTLYADAIIDGINSSNSLVLILSESAVASGHVGKELERASSKRKPILVLRMDKVDRDFKSLRNDPCFHAMLVKLNLI